MAFSNPSDTNPSDTNPLPITLVAEPINALPAGSLEDAILLNQPSRQGKAVGLNPTKSYLSMSVV